LRKFQLVPRISRQSSRVVHMNSNAQEEKSTILAIVDCLRQGGQREGRFDVKLLFGCNFSFFFFSIYAFHCLGIGQREGGFSGNLLLVC